MSLLCTLFDVVFTVAITTSHDRYDEDDNDKDDDDDDE